MNNEDCEGCTMHSPKLVCPIVDYDYCPCVNCLVKVMCNNMCFTFSHLIEIHKEANND